MGIQTHGLLAPNLAGAIASIVSRVLTLVARLTDTASSTRPDLNSSARLADAER